MVGSQFNSIPEKRIDGRVYTCNFNFFWLKLFLETLCVFSQLLPSYTCIPLSPLRNSSVSEEVYIPTTQQTIHHIACWTFLYCDSGFSVINRIIDGCWTLIAAWNIFPRIFMAGNITIWCWSFCRWFAGTGKKILRCCWIMVIGCLHCCRFCSSQRTFFFDNFLRWFFLSRRLFHFHVLQWLKYCFHEHLKRFPAYQLSGNPRLGKTRKLGC